MAGDREVSLRFVVTAEGLQIIDQVGQKLGVVQVETQKTTTGLTGVSSSLSSGLPPAASTAVSSLGAVAAALGVATTATGLLAAGVLAVRRGINELDAVNTLSLKTGQSAETLSRLAYSAELADVSTGELGTGLRFLAKNLDEARRGNEGAIETFGRLGVDFQQGLEPALAQAADRFNRLETAEAKTALAIELFGRSGQDLLPLLAEGSAGLKAQADEAERLGVVMSQDAVQAADEFNDNLTRLSAGAKGLAIDLANAVLPTLIEVTDELVEFNKNARESGVIAAAIKSLSSRGDFDTPEENIAAREKLAAQSATVYGNAGVYRIPGRDKSIYDTPGGFSTTDGGLASGFANTTDFDSTDQRAAFERDASLAEQARRIEAERVKEANEHLRLTKERVTLEQQALATTTQASVFRAETEVQLLQQRLGLLGDEADTGRQRLALAEQLDQAERRVLEARIAGLNAQRDAIASVEEPTAAQLAQVELITAEVDRLNALWAVTPSEVSKVTAEIAKANAETERANRETARASRIDLGDTLNEVITGTALGTGDLGDSLSRVGETLGSKLFAGVLKQKVPFDLSISENFLEKVPDWIETGASYASDAWSSTLDAMGLATESTTSRISDSFSRAFDEISGKANDTAQVIGGTLRNVPGVGNVATLFNGGAEVSLSRGADGRFTAVNEFEQKFTGANAGEMANVAGGSATSGATLGATVGAAAASFGIALGVQAGLEGIGEIRRLSKSDNPKDLDFARYGLTDPVQLGLQNILGVHDLTLLRGFSAMFSMGISEVAGQLFKAFGIFKPPTAEGVAGNQLGDILNEIGIPIARGAGGRRPGGPSTREFDPTKIGDFGYPQQPIPESVRADLRGSGLVAAFAQISAARFGGINGIGLQGEFDASSGPLRGILNNAAALGLSAEDTRSQVALITRGLSGKSFEESLLSLRKESQDRIFDLQRRAATDPNDTHGLTPGAIARLKPRTAEQEATRQAVLQGQIEKQQDLFLRGVAGLIEAYEEDLPRAVGAANIAVLAFGEDGELQMKALNRQLETAKNLAAGLDLGGAAGEGFRTGGKSFADQLTTNARSSAAEALLGGLSEGGIGDPFKEFTASIAEGTEALRNGNFEKANDIIERAGHEFDVARQSAEEFFDTARREAPALGRLIDRIEIEGLADGFKDAAKGLREEANDLGLSLLKPKQREAEIRDRLGQNQAEIDAILNSSGGADTADELRRLGELGTARRELLGDLGSVLDERYVDGSRREVAAMQEVQGGLTDLAGILEAAGISAKTQVDSLAEQTASTSANTAATDANTEALHAVADAVLTVGGMAGTVDKSTLAAALVPLILTALDDPRVVAKIRKS